MFVFMLWHQIDYSCYRYVVTVTSLDFHRNSVIAFYYLTLEFYGFVYRISSTLYYRNFLRSNNFTTINELPLFYQLRPARCR